MSSGTISRSATALAAVLTIIRPATVALAGAVSFRLSRTPVFHCAAVKIRLATAVTGAVHAMISPRLQSHHLKATILKCTGARRHFIFHFDCVEPIRREQVEQLDGAEKMW